MSEFAKNALVEVDGNGGTVFIDGQEFPWHVSSVYTNWAPGMDGAEISLTIPVAGPVQTAVSGDRKVDTSGDTNAAATFDPGQISNGADLVDLERQGFRNGMVLEFDGSATSGIKYLIRRNGLWFWSKNSDPSEQTWTSEHGGFTTATIVREWPDARYFVVHPGRTS